MCHRICYNGMMQVWVSDTIFRTYFNKKTSEVTLNGKFLSTDRTSNLAEIYNFVQQYPSNS